MLTAFLASLWGPVALALGIGFLASPKYYKQLYCNLEKESLSILTLSIFLIPLGIIHISLHNAWGSFTEGIISFLGWATLAKGVVLAVFPKFVDRAGEYEAKRGFLTYAGISLIILGTYLTWFAFF